VSRPMFPARIGAFDTPGDAEGIRLFDNLAYLADGSAGLTIVDVRNPAAPRGLASLNLPGYAFGLAITRSVSGSVTSTLALVAAGTGGLQIVDASNPAAPTRLGAYTTTQDLHAVEVVGPYAYLADADGGVVVLDISQPARPQRISALSTLSYARGLHLAGNLLYVADGEGGLISAYTTDTPGAPQTMRLPLVFNRYRILPFPP